MDLTPIDVPVPGLVVLIGPAGAGKSTLAARLFEPGEVISSDGLRATVGGDPADQRSTRPAFALLHREVARRLAAGHLVVVDATNVEAVARSVLLRLARAANVPATAIVIATPGPEIHARNSARRGRVVPAAIVDRHLDRVARLGRDVAAIEARLLAEGFTAVRVMARTADLNSVRLARKVGGRGPISPA